MFPVLLLAATALAAPYKVPGTTTVNAVVDLPLYGNLNATDDNWYIEGKSGEKYGLFLLSTKGAGPEGYGLVLTESAAKRFGLKPTGDEGKKTAKVTLAFGDVSISTTAAIGNVKGADGRVSIAAFPGLAWAIEASKGVVHVGPSGGSSVATTLGTSVAFTQVAKQEPKVGKDKQKVPAQLLVTEATISGVKLPVELALGAGTQVDTEADGADWFKVSGVENPKYALPDVQGQQFGEAEAEWREVGFGGQAVNTIVNRTGAGLTYRFGTPGQLGQDVLRHFDIGVDAGTLHYTLRANTGVVLNDYAPVREAHLKEALDKATATPGKDVDATNAAITGVLTPMNALYAVTGQWEKAKESAKRLTETDAKHCSAWHTYGTTLLASGDAAGAIEPLKKAAEMYQPWADKPLEERTKLQASEEKRAKSPDFDGVWAQPSSCFTAWSSLAEAYVASGNPAAVAAIYPAHEDLDDLLPLVAGNALLLQGNAAGAEAAYRQALQLSFTQNGFARGGMMMAVRGRNLDLALAQFEGPLDEEQGTLRYWLYYGELLRTKGGSGAAVSGLSAVLARNPWNVPGQLALANEQALAGQDNHGALAAAVARIDEKLAYAPKNDSLHAWKAEALRLQGKLPDAAAEAEKATTLDSTNGLGWFVRARIAESAGDAARAAELRKKAGQVGAGDPLYAMLLLP